MMHARTCLQRRTQFIFIFYSYEHLVNPQLSLLSPCRTCIEDMSNIINVKLITDKQTKDSSYPAIFSHNTDNSITRHWQKLQVMSMEISHLDEDDLWILSRWHLQFANLNSSLIWGYYLFISFHVSEMICCWHC